MATMSEFHFYCPCGAYIVSAAKVTQCGACGRVLDASAWGKPDPVKR